MLFRCEITCDPVCVILKRLFRRLRGLISLGGQNQNSSRCWPLRPAALSKGIDLYGVHVRSLAAKCGHQLCGQYYQLVRTFWIVKIQCYAIDTLRRSCRRLDYITCAYVNYIDLNLLLTIHTYTQAETLINRNFNAI